MAHVIAIQGIHGGSGATSICAGLAVALNELGHRTLALDFCENNHLGQLFGLAPDHTAGLLQAVVAGTLQDYLLESAEGYPFLPFGRLPRAQQTDVLAVLPTVLESLFAPLLAMNERIVLIDLSSVPTLWHSWVYQHAAVVLNVLQPEPRLVNGLLRYAEYQRVDQETAGALSMVLVNGIAPHLDLTRDSVLYLKAQLHTDSLVPVMIFRDQHVSEAFALQQPLRTFQSQSYAAQNFDTLAIWLCRTLADLPTKVRS